MDVDPVPPPPEEPKPNPVDPATFLANLQRMYRHYDRTELDMDPSPIPPRTPSAVEVNTVFTPGTLLSSHARAEGEANRLRQWTSLN